MANNILTKLFGNYSKRELKRVQPLVNKVLGLENAYKAMDDAELKAQTGLLKERLGKGETLDDILPEAFAACREAMDRVLSLRLFPVQVQGGIILHQGRIAEMKTGEGKTFTLALPAFLNALTGQGVHIVTVNEYLAKYQGEMMARVFNFMGLTVGLALTGMSSAEKREAYACDITYATNNELGFDYLRDNMVIRKEDKVQRGHHYAVVDEVDSILIDEARTPLIISGHGDEADILYQRANSLAKTLKPIRVKETDEKQDNDELYNEYDYIINEKLKTCSLTRRGVKKAENYFDIENLTDSDNIRIQHHVNQAIRAWGIMHKDQDYVVKDGEVIIVDEFTGRLMFGRRYNEGLHQAIEAKEGVEVARESKTLATITFQNYFRQYEKLSGMTGTAMTEQEEFSEIYRLDVVEIPTNRPMIREDCPDVVYKTVAAKFQAVIDDIAKHHEKGQPVLVGTITIEKSEELSKMLRQRGIKHQVLNAKFHEKEAQIVAQAGRKGAVTIATNMAGRGTDILLGGNAEFMAKAEMRKMGYAEELLVEATAYSHTQDEAILEARETFARLNQKYKEEIAPEAEEVKALGGLYIIGTERHESRRIDNQLRGRAGRQGDPGKSRFYISLEDDLMRLFGGERLSAIMDRMKIDDDMPIETGMVSNAIESAQRRVESRNFGIRKNVLQYDEVMNSQRQIIYGQRDQVLNGEDMQEHILKMINEDLEEKVKAAMPEEIQRDIWDLPGLCKDYDWLIQEGDLRYTPDELETLQQEDVLELLKKRAADMYAQREKKFTPQRMRILERVKLLETVDEKWMDHIDAMEQLQEGIRLRAYAQHDPVVEYRLEGFEMFDKMISAIREDTAKLVLTWEPKSEEAPKPQQRVKIISAGLAGDNTVKKQPVRKQKKPGRNELCPAAAVKSIKSAAGGTNKEEKPHEEKIKAWGLLVLAALLAFALSGCDIPMPGFADYDVSGYIQALLDSSYHNSHDSFIVVAQTTEEAARESHATTIENMVINFCNTYGVNPSEEQLSQLTEIFSQLLQHAKYTVREEQKVDTGYYIEVEVTPIVNFSDCSAQLEALRQQAQEEADALNTPSPSPEPEEDEDGDGGEDDWGEEERENDEEESPIATPKPVTTQVNPQELYMEKVVEFCRQQAAAIDYGVARTMSLDIRQTNEGELQLDLNQIENIDQTILQLTAG